MRRIEKNKIVKFVAGAILAICCIGLFWETNTKAAMQDEAEEYELMDTYSGHINSHRTRYFSFVIHEKSHVSISYSSNGDCGLSIYNSSGDIVLREEDIRLENYNTVTGWSVADNYRVLAADTYYIQLRNIREYSSTDMDYQFHIQAEKLIKFPRGQFASLKSTKAGKVTVKAKTAEDALGYRIQYSTDYTFKKDVKTVYSPTVTKTISGLKKGQRYYFKICPYNVYDDGTYAYGQNSKVKAVVVKK